MMALRQHEAISIQQLAMTELYDRDQEVEALMLDKISLINALDVLIKGIKEKKLSQREFDKVILTRTLVYNTRKEV